MDHILVGETIVGVYVAADKKAIRFDLAAPDNAVTRSKPGQTRAIIAAADGDCCSSTWIEALDQPTNLLGRVLAVEDIDMPDRGQPEEEYEVIAYYGCKITTDRGVCVIDFRNSSNGYYGGALVWPTRDGSDPYYYGGVFDQNVSAQEWTNVA